ncbi:MAG: hypothetical protein ACREAM_03310 [Blastocatellia bacterium]
MWEVFSFIFDSWPGVSLLLTATGAFSLWRVTRPYFTGLLIPVAMLLVRKAAFYLPVAGAISTQDRIIFWSLDAYIHVAGLTVVVLLGVAIKRGWDRVVDFSMDALDNTGCLIPSILVVILVAIIAENPDNILYALALSLIALTKILITNPLLLPLVIAALTLHIYNARYGRLFISREIGKLIVIYVPVGGILQFLAGLWHRSQANDIVQKLGAPKKNEYVVGRLTEIFSLWWKKLPEINECGINAVPSYWGWLGADCGIRQAVDAIPNIVSADTAIWWIPISAAAFLCLAIVVERSAGKKAKR